ncbi:hypothetical protein [Stakelama saccharophila]|uniref:Uncharacterized protein n=1 Tax=Stakelama saccharophila TaxID=3075605 RepID=A0ABZ0BBM5_9SPHN|nr:hypothetical protein [Stakelama sp. W311]WNO54660.1 hypothetical protein RPR59_05250 [Stakelama sp. W311]
MRFAAAAAALLSVSGGPALAAQAIPDDQSAMQAEVKAEAKASEAGFDLDTPIRVLVADPRAKAVLDKDMPGLSSDENFDDFKDMSLHELQPKTGGQLTDELLTKVGKDLHAIGTGARDGESR